jgi:D-alanine-D-alanine ligase-like ATP-grasp enzyme
MIISAGSLGRCAVLMGGSSAEREVSLMSGTGVLDALRSPPGPGNRRYLTISDPAVRRAVGNVDRRECRGPSKESRRRTRESADYPGRVPEETMEFPPDHGRGWCGVIMPRVWLRSRLG